MRALVGIILAISTACAPRPKPAHVLSVCDLAKDFTAYRGRLIAVRGVYFYGLRQQCESTCATGPWPSFIDVIGAGYTPRDEEQVDFVTDEASWAALDNVEREVGRAARKGARLEIWVTVAGKLRASSPWDSGRRGAPPKRSGPSSPLPFPAK